MDVITVMEVVAQLEVGKDAVDQERSIHNKSVTA